jgi:serine/threonine protein kinase/tetratricopeptide (TPR) repeat protein
MPSAGEHWRKIEALYHAVREQEPAGRAAFLNDACNGDSDLRREVESLLLGDSETAPAAGDGLFERIEGEFAGLAVRLLPGSRLGPYEIISQIGKGGMGEVWKARDTRLDRTVAIKVSKTDFSERFEREARAISALNHPHICTLYDVGSLPSGAGYMVTELVEGETLREWLKNPSSTEQSLGVARQVLEALRAAHGAGIVHRDLKPANIMVRADGYVKVLDFGLAKRIPIPGGPNSDEAVTVSAHGQMIGTIAYMSPEQILGQEVDARCDLFAVGIILYEMLNGRHPWPNKSSVDTLHAILNIEPPPIEGRWAPVVRKLLSKNREDRYSSAHAVLDALSRSATTATSSSAVTRLIVLPFRILRPHQESDFLAVSLPDAIATSLAGIESLVVRSTMMASKLASAEFDVKMISERAQVDAILTGTILADGEHLRVNTQLMHAPDGRLMWSNTVRASLRDIFHLQDELVDKVAQSLTQPSIARERSALKQDVPASALAYELYLRANQLTATGAIGQNPQAVLVARDLYARSTEEDPNFAPAWAGLGRMHRIAGKYAMGDLDEHFRLADQAFRRAFALNPESSLAHNFYTYLQTDLGRARNALERLLKRARTHRNDLNLFVGLVHACRYCGLTEASVAAHHTARRLDASATTTVASAYLQRGDWESALACSTDPYSRAAALTELKRTNEAGAVYLEIEKNVQLQQIRLLAFSIRSYLEGDTGKSLETLDELLRLPGPMVSDPESHFVVGRFLAQLGQPQRALDSLSRALDAGYNCHEALLSYGGFDSLRIDVRFRELVNRAAQMTREARAVFREGGGEDLLGIRF